MKRKIHQLYKKHFGKRFNLGRLLNELNLFGKGVELGVWKGVYADKYILKDWKGDHLYMVDRWESEKKWSENIDNLKNKNNLVSALDIVYKYTHKRCTMIKCEGNRASKFFAKNSLDFIYIDAGHSREEIKSDLEDWHDKIKLGGVIAGHDCMEDQKQNPVYIEVNRLAEKNGYEVNYSDIDSTFYIIKK